GVGFDPLPEAPELQQALLEQPRDLLPRHPPREHEHADDHHQVARAVHAQPGGIDARHPFAGHGSSVRAADRPLGRCYHTWPTIRGGIMADLSSQFEQAVADSKNLPERPDNMTLLKLYALYKQASAGDVDGKRPGF